jgi:hypothetical protein
MRNATCGCYDVCGSTTGIPKEANKSTLSLTTRHANLNRHVVPGLLACEHRSVSLGAWEPRIFLNFFQSGPMTVAFGLRPCQII